MFRKTLGFVLTGFYWCSLLLAPLAAQPYVRSGLYREKSGKDSIAEYYAKNISAENMSKNLHVLASDAYEGRETGMNGQKKAAAYISNQFKSAGIPPYKDSTYYQTYWLNMIVPKPAAIKINKKNYKANKDYYTYPDQEQQFINVDSIYFLGYGLNEVSYNDYLQRNVKNKVIMILSGEPISKDSVSLLTNKKTLSPKAALTKLKLIEASDKGVKAVLLVVDDIENEIKTNKHRLESPNVYLEQNGHKPFVIYISKKMANGILNAGKKDSVELIKKYIAENGKTLQIALKRKLFITINNELKKVSSENVLAYIEGSDLKDELVVVTAHYDHLGKHGKVVYNGADDDGSGTVAVMELAKTFAKAKQEGNGPRRSMLFMTVSGEEKGLLGSSYYVKNPVFSLKNTVCDLNIDMIGRLDPQHENNPNYVYIIGSDKLSTALHKASENANKLYTQLNLDYTFNDENDKNRFYYRSDHYNFAKKGIPVIFYFCGVHADYHKETDEVEKIDFKKMQKITNLVFYTAWDIANRDDRIIVDKQ